MTVANPSEDGDGIRMSNAKVELMDVAINKAKRIAELAPTPVRLAKQMMKEHFIDQLIETSSIPRNAKRKRDP